MYLLKKEMSCLIKKGVFIFHKFSNFHDADYLLYYPQISAFSFHISVVLLHQFLRYGG